jgi:hypothetical protein
MDGHFYSFYEQWLIHRAQAGEREAWKWPECSISISLIRRPGWMGRRMESGRLSERRTASSIERTH